MDASSLRGKNLRSASFRRRPDSCISRHIMTAFPPLFEYEKFVVEGSFEGSFLLASLDEY